MEEDKKSTALKRVVRHVRLFWNTYQEPMPLRTIHNYYKGLGAILGDCLEEEPLATEIMPLIRGTGGILLMPRPAWDKLTIEEREYLKERYLKLARSGRAKRVPHKIQDNRVPRAQSRAVLDRLSQVNQLNPKIELEPGLKMEDFE